MSPKEGQELLGQDKQYPVIHVDAVGHLELMMASGHLQRCIASREEEVRKNVKTLILKTLGGDSNEDWGPWLPERPDPEKIVEARLQVT